jgi:hypothetical protein
MILQYAPTRSSLPRPRRPCRRECAYCPATNHHPFILLPFSSSLHSPTAFVCLVVLAIAACEESPWRRAARTFPLMLTSHTAFPLSHNNLVSIKSLLPSHQILFSHPVFSLLVVPLSLTRFVVDLTDLQLFILSSREPTMRCVWWT